MLINESRLKSKQGTLSLQVKDIKFDERKLQKYEHKQSFDRV